MGVMPQAKQPTADPRRLFANPAAEFALRRWQVRTAWIGTWAAALSLVVSIGYTTYATVLACTIHRHLGFVPATAFGSLALLILLYACARRCSVYPLYLGLKFCAMFLILLFLHLGVDESTSYIWYLSIPCAVALAALLLICAPLWTDLARPRYEEHLPWDAMLWIAGLAACVMWAWLSIAAGRPAAAAHDTSELSSVVPHQLTPAFMAFGYFYILLFYLRIFKFEISQLNNDEVAPIVNLAGRAE